jgi:hypothetical protein
VYSAQNARKGSAKPRLFPPVSKPHTHITYMLRQCTSIVYWGGRIMYYHRSCEIFLFWRYPKRRDIYWLVEILSVDICNSLLFDLNGFFNKIMVITCYSNITSFFRFVNKRTTLSIGYNLINTCTGACDWLSRRKCTCWWIIVC